MPIVEIADMKAHLSLTDDQTDDDGLIGAKVEAAQNHVERLLGFAIADEFGDAVPPALREAVMQLAAWWYENREVVSDVSRPLPFGVAEIVNEYRRWTF